MISNPDEKDRVMLATGNQHKIVLEVMNINLNRFHYRTKSSPKSDVRYLRYRCPKVPRTS